MERFFELVGIKFLQNDEFEELSNIPGVTSVYNGLSSLNCTFRWYTVHYEDFSYEVYVGNTINLF